jgi:hypothetical protein
MPLCPFCSRTESRSPRTRALVAAFVLALAGSNLVVAPAVANHRSSDVTPAQLAPGEFQWYPQAAPAGPLLLVVSVATQRAHLYRNGVRIAVSTVSTGKPGDETPPGVYTILQKHEKHYSNLYNDAPMPFMQRLTWDGVALHAGRIPGYPASHGCVRLPLEFARRLFSVSELGMTVVVVAADVQDPALAHPRWLAPPVPGREAVPVPVAPLAGVVPGVVEPVVVATVVDGTSFWQPERSPSGPLTLLLTSSDRTVRVLRGGVAIGQAAFELDGEEPLGTQVLQLQDGTLEEESRYVPGRRRLRWTRVSMEDGGADDAAAVEAVYARIHVSPEFARRVYPELAPGTTVVLTDLPADLDADAQPVLETAPAEAGGAH